MASRDALFTPWLKFFNRARAHGTLEMKAKQFSQSNDISLCPLHACMVHACLLQSAQPVWALLVGVLMCHWGSFETVPPVHWVRDGVLQCIAKLGRIGLCGKQPGAFGLSDAEQCLQTVSNKKRCSACIFLFLPLLSCALCSDAWTGVSFNS